MTRGLKLIHEVCFYSSLCPLWWLFIPHRALLCSLIQKQCEKRTCPACLECLPRLCWAALSCVQRDKTGHWHASHIQAEDFVDRLLRSTDVTLSIFGNHIIPCGFRALLLTDRKNEPDSASVPFSSGTDNVPITLHKLINLDGSCSPLYLV